MITKKNLNKKVELLGIVVKIGKPYIRITSARFECPSCGCIIAVLQHEKRLREPTRCSCGRRGGFKMFETKDTEGQDIYVSEKGTEFGYAVYLEKPKLIRILTKIQEGCAVKVEGIVRVQYSKGSAIGDLVIFATKLEQNKRKKK